MVLSVSLSNLIDETAEVGRLGWAQTFTPEDTNQMVSAAMTTRSKGIVQNILTPTD